jgi:hypothetical protein
MGYGRLTSHKRTIGLGIRSKRRVCDRSFTGYQEALKEDKSSPLNRTIISASVRFTNANLKPI